MSFDRVAGLGYLALRSPPGLFVRLVGWVLAAMTPWIRRSASNRKIVVLGSPRCCRVEPHVGGASLTFCFRRFRSTDD